MSFVPHHWLRHRNADRVFHAHRTAGTESLCGQAGAFKKLDDMDVPGERSVCCHACCELVLKSLGCNIDLRAANIKKDIE